jgi:hypothetical protein
MIGKNDDITTQKTSCAAYQVKQQPRRPTRWEMEARTNIGKWKQKPCGSMGLVTQGAKGRRIGARKRARAVPGSLRSPSGFKLNRGDLP